MIQIVVSAINSCNIHKAVDCDHDRNTKCWKHRTLLLACINEKCLPGLNTKLHTYRIFYFSLTFNIAASNAVNMYINKLLLSETPSTVAVE